MIAQLAATTLVICAACAPRRWTRGAAGVAAISAGAVACVAATGWPAVLLGMAAFATLAAAVGDEEQRRGTVAFAAAVAAFAALIGQNPPQLVAGPLESLSVALIGAGLCRVAGSTEGYGRIASALGLVTSAALLLMSTSPGGVMLLSPVVDASHHAAELVQYEREGGGVASWPLQVPVGGAVPVIAVALLCLLSVALVRVYSSADSISRRIRAHTAVASLALIAGALWFAFSALTPGEIGGESAQLIETFRPAAVPAGSLMRLSATSELAMSPMVPGVFCAVLLACGLLLVPFDEDHDENTDAVSPSVLAPAMLVIAAACVLAEDARLSARWEWAPDAIGVIALCVGTFICGASLLPARLGRALAAIAAAAALPYFLALPVLAG